MKDIIYKVVYGFLFGIGLSVALFGTLYIYETAERNDDAYVYKEFNKESGLEITGEHDRRIEDGVIVLGALENNGEDTWRNIGVEAEVYDKNGIFIDECTTNIEKELSPGQKENFKITCGGCSNNKIPEHDKITVKIQSARYVRESDT